MNHLNFHQAKPAVSPARHNPRYEAYARANNRTIDEQIAHDREEWPGGHLFGFIMWSGEQLTAFLIENPDALLTSGSPQAENTPGKSAAIDHDAYDAWLEEKFPRPTMKPRICQFDVPNGTIVL